MGVIVEALSKRAGLELHVRARQRMMECREGGWNDPWETSMGGAQHVGAVVKSKSLRVYSYRSQFSTEDSYKQPHRLSGVTKGTADV